VPLFRSPETVIASLIVLGIILLVSFPIHEFSHALAAYELGDSTAKLFGRLTLNPIAHFDPVGGLMLAVSILFAGIGLGWAKPTPVNVRNLRGGRWGEAIVAAAGPISNLVLALAVALPLRYINTNNIDLGILTVILQSFVFINLALAFFNLLPIPPLDGAPVLFAFLDPQTAWRLRPLLQQYGFFILLAALLFPIFGGQTLLGLVFADLIEPLYGLLVGR
jgi:Zn-dependent protease